MTIAPCWVDCEVAVPMKPVTKAYVTTAAATAMTMSSSVAIIGETPFLFLFKLIDLIFFPHVFVYNNAGAANKERVDRRLQSAQFLMIGD
jgi:hypothetical protein